MAGQDDLGAHGPAAPRSGGTTLGGEFGAFGGYGAGPSDLEQDLPPGGAPPPNFRVGQRQDDLFFFAEPESSPQGPCERLTACYERVVRRCVTDECRTRFTAEAEIPQGRCGEMLPRAREDAARMLPRGVTVPALCSTRR